MRHPVVNADLDREIERHIDDCVQRGLWSVTNDSPVRGRSGSALFIKFMSAQYGGAYSPLRASRPSGLFISTSPGFTWGNGCYITSLSFGLSAAIYGRCGVVAEADPSGWRIFNAADPHAQQLYIVWVGHQPYARMLMLTTHSQLANQYLRNLFKTHYRIDCVVFPPDEINFHYSSRRTDRWLAVTDWRGSVICNGGHSARFQSPRLAAVISEEFEKTHGGIGRRTLIGPLQVPLPHATTFSAAITTAYNSSTIATISP
jgi:hypothetical protein